MRLISALLLPLAATAAHAPGARWEAKPAPELGLDAARLERLAADLGGYGCVVRGGYVAHRWGPQGDLVDWLSSAKPVLSTLLFFAIQEGKVASVDTPIREFGWNLSEKDRGMTFRHLASMTSGYGRPDPPGAAWAYNDFAINLYQKTLFDRVFQADPDAVANHSSRFGAIGVEDGVHFRPSNRRLYASVRDFARIAWVWLNRGAWGEKRVLSERFFTEYVKPQVAADVPHTRKADTDDYLKTGTFGGGSDHFTDYGAGIYGFNWWFNARGRLHPDRDTWPGAPPDTYMSIGAGGNCAVIIPSLDLVLVSARGAWGSLKPGDPDAPAARHIRALVSAAAK